MGIEIVFFTLFTLLLGFVGFFLLGFTRRLFLGRIDVVSTVVFIAVLAIVIIITIGWIYEFEQLEPFPI